MDTPPRNTQETLFNGMRIPNSMEIVMLRLAMRQDIIAIQKEAYPPKMVETKVLESHINSPFSFGAMKMKTLQGYLLGRLGEDEEIIELIGCKPGTEHQHAYLYDIAVRPSAQGNGVASALLTEFFDKTRHYGLSVALHCRYTSYPIFSNSERMARYGYFIKKDKFLPRFYREHFDVDEDAHHLVLAPIVQKHS